MAGPPFPGAPATIQPSRDQEYRQLFESTDPYAVFRLLHKHKIAYVAIDDGIRRNNEFIKRPNEELYSLNLPKVWEDKTNHYYGLVIYKVPDPPPKVLKRPDPKKINQRILQLPPVSVFQGGKGEGRGQFDFPRGIAADRSGNIFVADSSNNRVQKFAATGAFLSMFGGRALPGRIPGTEWSCR